MLKKMILILLTIILVVFVVGCSQQDPFENSIYSEQPEIVTYQDYMAETTGLPSEALDPILAAGSEKSVIESGGLFQDTLLFKDSDGDGEIDLYEDWRLSPRERATDLTSQMSIEQKLPLLLWGETPTAGENFEIDGLKADGTAGDETPAAVIVSGVRFANNNFDTSGLDSAKYLNNVQGLTERLDWGIPYFFSRDPAWGQWSGNEIGARQFSGWPYFMGLGSMDDLSVTAEFGEIMRQELRMSGIHSMLGPQADLGTEPRWARVQHTIHADADVVTPHFVELVKGIQGYNLDKNDIGVDGVVTFIKHFPGAGSNEEGMDSHTYAGRYSVFPGGELDEHLKPFVGAFQEAKAGGVMALYSIVEVEGYKDQVDGAPVDEGAGYSKVIMTDLLRDEIGYDGAVVSDYRATNGSAWGHLEDSVPAQSAEMINAGTFSILGGTELSHLAEAVEQGLLSEEQIDEAIIHTLELSFSLGLFENPYVDMAEATAFWDPEGDAMQDRLAAGDEAMKKAMVLAVNPEVASNVDLLPITAGIENYIEAVDTNDNGTVDVYFDSAFPDADSGQEMTYAQASDTQYITTNFVDDISDADIVIVRIYSRGGTYFGTQGGVPLDFVSPTYVFDREAQEYTDEEIEHYSDFPTWTFGDWSDVTGGEFMNQGYETYLGYSDSITAVNNAIAAKESNPDLKIIVGMTASRPGIVSSFLDDIDGLLIDFAATDSAFLDVVFWQDGSSPGGRLPIEIPADMASVEAQDADVACDTANPTFECGHGLDYATGSGYGG